MQSVAIGWGRLGGGGIRSFCNRGGCIAASQWIASATRNQNSHGVCRYGSESPVHTSPLQNHRSLGCCYFSFDSQSFAPFFPLC